MSDMASRVVRTALIEQSVRSYFANNVQEAFSGLVTTDEVMEVARMSFQRANGLHFTRHNEGQTYDLIREWGPVGEGDEDWLWIMRRFA